MMPTPVIEIERKGSGRKSSIKGMSNLIHNEVKMNDSYHSDRKSEKSLENDFHKL